MTVVAKLLHRGYNVAVPEVDRGDDLYVVDERTGEMARVQVKSATGKGKKRVAGAFNISLAQLETPRQPELIYVLVLYRDGGWRDYLVIPRDELHRLHFVQRVGHLTDHGRRVVLHITFTSESVVCNGVSLDQYRENWQMWPEVKH